MQHWPGDPAPPVADRGSQRDQRHRALVDAARALATEHGADGFTVDRVAAPGRGVAAHRLQPLRRPRPAAGRRVRADPRRGRPPTSSRASTASTGAAARRGRTTASRSTPCARRPAASTCRLPSSRSTTCSVRRTPPTNAPTRSRAPPSTTSAAGCASASATARRRSTRSTSSSTLALLTSGIATLARHWLAAHPDLAADVGPTPARTGTGCSTGSCALRSGHAG